MFKYFNSYRIKSNLVKNEIYFGRTPSINRYLYRRSTVRAISTKSKSILQKPLK